MSISLATRGMLWPQYVVIKEQFVEICSEVVDTVAVEIQMECVSEIVSSVESNEIQSTVEQVDTANGDIESVEVEGCVK